MTRHLNTEWNGHYNRGRPHMSLGPGIPDPPPEPIALPPLRHSLNPDCVQARVILGGLHHEYVLVAELRSRQ